MNERESTRAAITSRSTSTAPPPDVVNLQAFVAQVLALDTGVTGRATLPLVSYAGLKVLVIGIRKGGRWDEHSTPGRISVQTLKGHLQMHLQGKSYDLPAGRLLALDSNVAHDVEALEDSAFLLTVARQE